MANQPARDARLTRTLLRCFGYLRPYAHLTTGVYLAMLVIIGLTLAIPQLVQRVVDEGIGAGNQALLIWSVAALLGLSLLKGVLTYWQGRWAETSSQGVAYDLRGGLHRQLLALSFSYHDRAETGQLLSRALQDVERVRFLTGRAFLRIVEAIVLLLGTAIALAAMNPSLALLALGTMPILAYRAMVFGRSSRPLSRAIQNQLAVLTTRLEQNLRGARVVKAFAQEGAEVGRFVEANDHWFDLSARYARLQAINTPMLDLIANLGTVFIIWYGGNLVANGTLTVGELVAFSTYLGQLISPVRRLGTIIPAVADAAAAGDRVFEILDARPEVHDAPGAAALAPGRGRVQFEHVSFSYFGRHRVLHDITFTAELGQVIALLGATGSGKSTIINLLPRFYDPTGGRITIDDQDIRGVTLASLRDQISIVLQESTLFAASVRENIAFGCPGASEEAIRHAARTAQAHDFITALPQGYDTEVGERGVMLSGGQKQRIAIARALLRDPLFLILDDATASVDTQTEHQIQLALRALMRGRTSFVIAQRLSTLREADLILVLERGRIAARGTHQELLQTQGLYAAIAARQLRPEPSEADATGVEPQEMAR